MISNFPNDFKTFRIFPDDCQFSEWFQNCPDFPDDCQFSGLFQNFPDFSRWLPIFWMILKLSGFSRWLPIFRIISKLSGFFQMTANFPDDFKTVKIFPDECQFSWWFQKYPYFLDADGNHRCRLFCPTNFCLGGGVTQKSATKLRRKQVFLVQKTLFHIFQPFLVHFIAFLVHF